MSRKKPMGEQSVPEWGLDPWIEIPQDEAVDYVFLLVCQILEEEEKEKEEK